MNTKISQRRGAVLLIAILVSSVALSVGLGVYNRTYRELLFSSFWKQTQIAFAAADSGLECAMYWIQNPGVVTCFGSPILGWDPVLQTGGFTVDIVSGVGPCVIVATAWDAGLSATTTTARGYNVSCSSVTAGTNPRIVERGLRVSI